MKALKSKIILIAAILTAWMLSGGCNNLKKNIYGTYDYKEGLLRIEVLPDSIRFIGYIGVYPRVMLTRCKAKQEGDFIEFSSDSKPCDDVLLEYTNIEKTYSESGTDDSDITLKFSIWFGNPWVIVTVVEEGESTKIHSHEWHDNIIEIKLDKHTEKFSFSIKPDYRHDEFIRFIQSQNFGILEAFYPYEIECKGCQTIEISMEPFSLSSFAYFYFIGERCLIKDRKLYWNGFEFKKISDNINITKHL